MKSAFAILTFFAFLTTGLAAVSQDDVWFFADFDSPAELNGMAFLRDLPSGNGETEAGIAKGKFGSGYAFIGPKTRCNGMFWRESRPEALGEFPWKEGSFSCWYKSPEGMADAEASPAFAFGGFKWTGDKFQTYKYSGGWLDLASSHDRKGEWRHFAAVWCDDELAVYRDGEKIASRKKPQREDPFAAGAVPVFEIGTAGYGTCAANLILDEIGIFRRALTTGEIKALSSAMSGLRAGKLSILAAPPGMTIYYRNEENAAIRQRVFSPEECTLRLTGEVGGKPIKSGEVKLPAGVSEFDVSFDASRYMPGKYEWSFNLTDGTGKTALDRKGTLTVCGRMERDGFKVLSWGGNKPISPDFLSMLGVNTVNVHPWQLSEQRESACRGMGLSTFVFNWRKYIPLDLDENAIRRGVRDQLEHLRGFHGWTMSLMNSEQFCSGTMPYSEACKSPRWRKMAEDALGFDLPPTSQITNMPARVNFAAAGRDVPRGVLQDDREIELLTWFYRDGNPLYVGNKASIEEIHSMSPGNVCWAEPIIEAWNIAAHHDMTADWIYNYWTHSNLANLYEQYAQVRPHGKPYMPTLSMASEHEQVSSGHPVLKSKSGQPSRIKAAKTADELAIATWQCIGAVPAHDLSFFSIDSWEEGLKNAAIYATNANAIAGMVVEKGDPEKYGQLFKRKLLPAARLLRDMPNVRAPIAFLMPVENRYLGGWPVQLQLSHELRMAAQFGVPFDVIPDDEFNVETLSQYPCLFLSRVRVITPKHLGVLKSLPESVKIVADAQFDTNLLPRVQHIDADFGWYTKWETTLKPSFLEWYTNRVDELRSRLAAKSDQDGEFSAQTFIKEYKGAKYVVVVNDKRTRLDSIQTRCVTNEWYMPHGAPQRIKTHLPVFDGGATYEFNAKSQLPNSPTVELDYGPAEGRIFCLYPRPLAAPKLEFKNGMIEIAIEDVDGHSAPGRQIVKLSMRNADGSLRDESGYYSVEDGRVAVQLIFADEEKSEGISVSAVELTTGNFAKLHTSRIDRMREDKLGLFIHWGLYSIPARPTGEWTMYKDRIPASEYNRLADEFKPPASFSPREWVKLARKVGCRYAVLTTRHHDGFCLFATKTTDFNSVKTAAKRDFVREFAEACREEGIRVGFYYSIMNWQFDHSPGGVFDRKVWDEQVRTTHAALEELMSNYGKVDYLWYDGCFAPGSNDFETMDRMWRIRDLNAMVRRLQPDILINDRSRMPQDYVTPEQSLAAPARGQMWESCITCNHSWGYVKSDNDWKSAETLFRSLLHCARFGGNILINIGPRADGSVPVESVKALEGLGERIAACPEAIYGSERDDWTEATHEGGVVTKAAGGYWFWALASEKLDGVESMKRVGKGVFKVAFKDGVKPCNWLGGRHDVEIKAGAAPVLGDDTDVEAPPLGSIEPVSMKDVQAVSFDLPSGGRWKLDVGFVSLDGFKDTFTKEVESDAAKQVEVILPFKTRGVYARRMSPVWMPVAPRSWEVAGTFNDRYRETGFDETMVDNTFKKNLLAESLRADFHPVPAANDKADRSDVRVNHNYSDPKEDVGYSFAKRTVKSDRARTVFAALGVDWWGRVYVNGGLALDLTSGWKPRPFPLKLKAGENEILVVTHGGSRQHWFTFFANMDMQ